MLKKNLLLFFGIFFILTLGVFLLTRFSDVKKNQLNEAGEKLSHAQHLAIVLGGGGALGAYEMGVWEMLHEYNLDKNIQYVAGSSIGSINGAAMFLDQYEEAYSFWNTVKPSQVLDINKPELITLIDTVFDEEKLAKLVESNEKKEINTKLKIEHFTLYPYVDNPSNLCDRPIVLSKTRENFTKQIRQFFNSPFKIDTKKDLIITRVNNSNPSNPILETPSYSMGQLTNNEEIINNLLASSAANPLFECYTFNGTTYSDGGQKEGDNLPYTVLERLHPEVDVILVVSLIKSRDKLPEGDKYIILQLNKVSNIKEVLFNTFETNELIKKGYNDAMSALTQK